MVSENISLREFLKKYTAIPAKFIDRHLKYYDKCVNNKFGIEIKEVIKYLNINRYDNFVTRFKKKYVLNRDYIYDCNIIKPAKGDTRCFYYMTFETFSDICMLSNTDIAKDVRDYFIKIHQFIIDYKNTINEAINTKFNKILYGYVYILLVNKKRDIRKIGIIKPNNDQKIIKNRLRAYMTGKDKHPDLEFILKIEDTSKITMCIKRMLKNKTLNYKENQEIYKIPFKEAIHVVVSCGCINGSTFDKFKKSSNCFIVFTDPDKKIKLN